MALPNDVDYQLQDFGQAFTTVVNGGVVPFYGILDVHQGHMDKGGGKIGLTVMFTTLHVSSTVAASIAINSRIASDDVTYQVRDKLLADDGALTTLIIDRDDS